jgi:hypothetical protein
VLWNIENRACNLYRLSRTTIIPSLDDMVCVDANAVENKFRTYATEFDIDIPSDKRVYYPGMLAVVMVVKLYKMLFINADESHCTMVSTTTDEVSRVVRNFINKNKKYMFVSVGDNDTIRCDAKWFKNASKANLILRIFGTKNVTDPNRHDMGAFGAYRTLYYTKINTKPKLSDVASTGKIKNCIDTFVKSVIKTNPDVYTTLENLSNEVCYGKIINDRRSVSGGGDASGGDGDSEREGTNATGIPIPIATIDYDSGESKHIKGKMISSRPDSVLIKWNTTDLEDNPEWVHHSELSTMFK